jgi:hypothetical protein
MTEFQAWITGTLTGLLMKEIIEHDLGYEIEIQQDGEGNYLPQFEVKDSDGERVKVFVQALVPKRSPARAEQRLQDEFQDELADMYEHDSE